MQYAQHFAPINLNSKLFVLQVNLYEIMWIVLISAVLTLFFDLPFQNIKKCIFKKPTLNDANLTVSSVKKIQ